jgi:hypothetical protein
VGGLMARWCWLSDPASKQGEYGLCRRGDPALMQQQQQQRFCGCGGLVVTL